MPEPRGAERSPIADSPDPLLERRCRRLLWVYPRRYRRLRGDEIVTTLLDGAEAGRTRPAFADASNVIICGLRQWFRPRGGRSAAAAVAFVAVAGLVFGAALGSWWGWRPAQPLLNDHRMVAQTAHAALPGLPSDLEHRLATNTAQGFVSRTPAPFGNPDDDWVSTDSWRSDVLHFVLGGDNYGPEAIDVGFTPDRPRPADLAGARAAMTAAGWHTIQTWPAGFIARKGDLLAEVSVGQPGESLTSQGDRHSRLLLWADRRHDPSLVLPLSVGGGLLGFIGGWLVAASVTRRLSRQHFAVRLSGAALFLTAAIFTSPLLLIIAVDLTYYFVAREPNVPVWFGFHLVLVRPPALIGAILTLGLIAVIGVARTRAETEGWSRSTPITG